MRVSLPSQQGPGVRLRLVGGGLDQQLSDSMGPHIADRHEITTNKAEPQTSNNLVCHLIDTTILHTQHSLILAMTRIKELSS